MAARETHGLPLYHPQDYAGDDGPAGGTPGVLEALAALGGRGGDDESDD